MRRPLRTPILYIYRHLLREASYLPPVCHAYVKTQIRERFRKHRKDTFNAPETKRRIQRARHDLRYLWAANNGLLENMQHTLLLVFGRQGRRRRELIHNFVTTKEDPPSDSDELARQIQKEHEQGVSKSGKRRKPDWLDKWDLAKLGSLVASQGQRSFWCPKPEIKGNRTDPAKDIPVTNIWGRPLAAKLSRSKLRKGYKKLINRVMAPVERSEWDTLRLLATGKAERSLWEMPARRPRGKSLYGDEDEEGKKPWDWQKYATEPVRSIERGQSRSQKARTGEQGEGPYGQTRAIGLHRYTPRMWRRLYTKIWEMTPTMVKKADQEGKWDILWGQPSREIPVAAPAHSVFFENMPEQTRTGKGKQKRGPYR